MKAILVVVLILAIFGYIWYEDVLPFGRENIPAWITIDDIYDMLTLDGQKVIYYSFENVPAIPDKQIPLYALKKAIHAWEENNPNLKFIESENPNIEIRWQVHISATHTGLATCNTLFGISSYCVLDISVGAKDCNNNFIQNDENMLINILMHEIGHALGLGHTIQPEHLMFSTESPQEFFDEKKYVIPDRLDGFFVGQKSLIAQKTQLGEQIASLDDKISDMQLQYDKDHKAYKLCDGKTLSSNEYQKAQQTLAELNSFAKKINEMIHQQNQLIIKINDIVNQLGCNPNFETSSHPNNMTNPTASAIIEIPIHP